MSKFLQFTDERGIRISIEFSRITCVTEMRTGLTVVYVTNPDAEYVIAESYYMVIRKLKLAGAEHLE